MNKENIYKRTVTVLSWAAKIVAAGFVVLFLVFFIGEGGPGELMSLNWAEKLGLAFMPVVFAVGLVIAWKRERTGGIVMLISVFGFNLVRVIFKREFTEFEFAFLLIPGMILALMPYLSGRMKST